MLQQLLYPDGSPILMAAAWSLAAIIVLLAWCLVSPLFYMFYVAFRAMAGAVVGWLFGRVKEMFELSKTCLMAVPGSYTAIADPKRLFAVLPPRIEALRRSVLGSKHAVAAAAKKQREKLSAAGAGRASVFKDVGVALKKLERVAAIDLQEIKSSSGPVAAVMRTLLFTLLAAFAAVVNAFMLEQFFRSFFGGLTVPLVLWPLPVVLALVYTAIELALGIVLENQNARRESEGLGFGMFQIIIVALIVPMVVLEVGFYTMLSFDVPWPWPEQYASQIPYWMNGWLGLMGIFIGGGVAVAGYAAGRQWEEMFRSFSIAALHSTISNLPPNLKAAQAALPQTASAVSASSDIIDQVAALQGKLDDVLAANDTLSQGTPVLDGDAMSIRRNAVLAGVLGPLAILGSVIVFTDYLNGTVFAKFGAWAPPVVAGLAALLAMFFGDILRGSVLVSSSTRSDGKETFKVNTTGGAMLSRAIGGALSLVLITGSVWAASGGGQNWNVGAIAWALLVSGGCIGLGAFFLERIVAGVLFYLKIALFSASSVVVFVLTAIVTLPIIFLKTFEIFIFGLLALPVLALRAWRGEKAPPRHMSPSLRAPA